MANILTILKQREDYILYNDSLFNGYLTITKSNCNGEEQVVQVSLSSKSSYVFSPKEDGEYTVLISILDLVGDEPANNSQTVIITHYPFLINRVMIDVYKVLGNTNCTPVEDCLTSETIDCLDSQNVYGELQLLYHLMKSINTCNGNSSVINDTITSAIETYKCEFIRLLCDKELDIKIRGKAKYSNEIFKKLVSITYLALYYYEREITNPAKEYVDFLNNKYNYNEIKKGINKSGVDTVVIENLFMEVFFFGCDSNEPEEECTTACFNPIVIPQEKLKDFAVGEMVFGIYDTIELRNECLTTEYFINKEIYSDLNFSVSLKAQGNSNIAIIKPGETLLVDVVFKGTKPTYSLMTIPLKLDDVLINTYLIRFLVIVPEINHPPIISNIAIEFDNRKTYTFKVSDFEAHYSDIDGDPLGAIVLVGDTSRFKFDGLPYLSGTQITKPNITKLTHTPLDTDVSYDVIVHWRAYDSKGLSS